MKMRSRNVLLLLFFCSMVLLLNLKTVTIKAVDEECILNITETYSYTEEGASGQYSFSISNDCLFKMNFENTDAGEGIIEVSIKDENGNVVYSNKIIEWIEELYDPEYDGDEYDKYYEKVDLKKGNYVLEVSVQDDDAYLRLKAYADYYPCVNHPEFEISDDKIELYVGKSKTLKITSNPEDVTYNVKWSSNKKTVAVVDDNGKVTAKKAGAATITAKIGEQKYTCKVSVKKKNLTYSQMVKQAKKYKKGKVKFKQVDVGYHCRLYEDEYVGSNFYKSSLSGFVFTCAPCIDIKKNKDTVNISLCLTGTYTEISFEEYDPEYTKLKLYTNSRKNIFELDSFSGNSRVNSKGIYTNKYKWKVKISTNGKPNKEKLNKLTAMLKKKKKFKIRLQDDDNYAYTMMQTDKTTGQQWMKLINAYNKLLKMYE